MVKFKKLAIFVLAVAIIFAVQANAAKKKVKLSTTKISLYVGDSYKLKLKNNKKKVKWSSSNKKVATVSKKGKVKAKKKGSCRITAKVGKKKYVCKVTVKKEKVRVVKVMVTPTPLPTEVPRPTLTPRSTLTPRPTLTPIPAKPIVE